MLNRHDHLHIFEQVKLYMNPLSSINGLQMSKTELKNGYMVEIIQAGVPHRTIYNCSTDVALKLGLQHSLHALLDCIEIVPGGDIIVLALLAHSQGEILGHDSLLIDNVNACLFERLGELDQLGSVVELTSLGKTSAPGKDRCDRVGRCWVALLVLTEMASDCTVCGLGLERFSIWCDENRSHQTQTTKTLGDNVGLDITVIIYTNVSIPA